MSRMKLFLIREMLRTLEVNDLGHALSMVNGTDPDLCDFLLQHGDDLCNPCSERRVDEKRVRRIGIAITAQAEEHSCMLRKSGAWIFVPHDPEKAVHSKLCT